MSSTRARAVRRTLAGLAAALAALAAAPYAAAHAQVVSTQPADNTVVQESPDRAVVIFSEAVETAFGALRVYDAGGNRVDTGELERPSPDTVAIGLEPDLADGTYTVTWRVVSADSHAIQGAWVFHVGAPGAQAGGIASEVLGQGAPRSVEISAGIVRFAGFASLLLSVGGVTALLYFFATASAAVRRKLWTLVAAAAGLLALCGPAALVLQGATAGGFSVGDAARWSVVSAVLDTRFGQVTLVRTVIALLLVLVAIALRSLGDARDLATVAGLAAAALVFTPGLAGHASVGGTLSLVSDVVHVAAASVWTGGLAFLVAGLLLAGNERWKLASTSVPRFSTAAVVSVAALVTAGVVNGYLQVRSWDALFTTTYGRLLLVKIALVLPLLGLGAFNNRFAVPKLRAGAASAVERQRFLRMAGAELAVMVVIVGVTAALVAEPPAKAASEAAALTGKPRGEVLAGPFHLSVEAKPGTAGTNDIVFDVIHGKGIAELGVSASLPSQEIGPLDFTAEKVSARRWVVRDAALAIPGSWILKVQIRQGEFDAYAGDVTITIGAAG